MIEDKEQFLTDLLSFACCCTNLIRLYVNFNCVLDQMKNYVLTGYCEKMAKYLIAMHVQSCAELHAHLNCR